MFPLSLESHSLISHEEYRRAYKPSAYKPSYPHNKSNSKKQLLCCLFFFLFSIHAGITIAPLTLRYIFSSVLCAK